MNPSDNELKHYGILGMKWGVRRYQYKDGTLTPAGRKRYAGDRVIASGNKYEVRVNRKTPLTEEDMKKVIDFIDMNRKLDDLSNDSSRAAKREARRDQKTAFRQQQKVAKQSRQEKREAQKADLKKQKQQSNQKVEQIKVQNTKTGQEKVAKFLANVGTIVTVGTSAFALYQSIKKFMSDDGSEAEMKRLEQEAKRVGYLQKIDNYNTNEVSKRLNREFKDNSWTRDIIRETNSRGFKENRKLANNPIPDSYNFGRASNALNGFSSGNYTIPPVDPALRKRYKK